MPDLTMRAAPQRFASAVLHRFVGQCIAFAGRPFADMPAAIQQGIVLAGVATQHDAKLSVVAVFRAPGANIIGNAKPHTAVAVIHRALLIGRIKKKASHAVARGDGIFDNPSPVPTRHAHIAHPLL